MNRLIRGPVVLAVALVALSCKGDPTSSLRNGVDQLIADPGALFLRPDSTKPLIVGAVDEQGNQIQAHYTLGAVSAGLSVIVDPGFNLVYNDNGVLVKPDQATREQFLVTATAGSGDLSFVVNGGGKSVTIPVRLLPDSASATVSNATPANQDTVIITLSPDFKFTPTGGVTLNGIPGAIIDRAADSSSVTFVVLGGAAVAPGTHPVVTGVVLTYLGSPLSLPATATMDVPVGFVGAVAIATAPTIVIPPTGENSTYFDVGATAAAAECGNVGAHCRFYKIVLAAPRTFTVTLNWGNTADFGGYFIDAAGNDQFGDFACDAHGSGATAQPETCTETLPAGTWYLALADFTAAAQNTTYRTFLEGN